MIRATRFAIVNCSIMRMEISAATKRATSHFHGYGFRVVAGR
jgi:hypothetical protein